MPTTVEYWRPTDTLFHALPPGIAVLTNDTNWYLLNEITGLYDASPFPQPFKGQVYRALMYLNATPAGATLLWGIYTATPHVDISPSSLGNNVQSANSNNAVNRVVAELLGQSGAGDFTNQALNAINVPALVQTEWLRHFINHSPRWALDSMPGNNGGYISFLERLRQRANQWMLLADPRYLRWSDSNEGYFNAQTFGGPMGVGPENLGLTNLEVVAWLAGNNLPARLTAQQKQSVVLATIVALKDVSPPSIGSDAHVRWNPTGTNPLNDRRPPAIGLAHELLHAYFSCRGEQLGRDDGHYTTALFEYRCVGLGPWDEHPLSENAIRKEWWTHACPEIPMGDHQNRKAVPKRISYD